MGKLFTLSGHYYKWKNIFWIYWITDVYGTQFFKDIIDLKLIFNKLKSENNIRFTLYFSEWHSFWNRSTNLCLFLGRETYTKSSLKKKLPTHIFYFLIDFHQVGWIMLFIQTILLISKVIVQIAPCKLTCVACCKLNSSFFTAIFSFSSSSPNTTIRLPSLCVLHELYFWFVLLKSLGSKPSWIKYCFQILLACLNPQWTWQLWFHRFFLHAWIHYGLCLENCSRCVQKEERRRKEGKW